MAQTHPLFLACTRPAMALGIPIEAFGVILIGCGEVYEISGFFSHSLWRIAWNVGFVAGAYGTCRLLTAIDHNIFRILRIWLLTKARASRNALYWGGSSASHMPLLPARKPEDIPHLG